MSNSERPGTHFDAETLVRRAQDIIADAKSMPLSGSVLVSKDEVLELLQEAVRRLPDELRESRWMLKERQEFLERTRREGEEILDAARQRAQRMVQRAEIVREAQRLAQRTVDDARDEARRLRHEAEDYCDQKLAAFQVVLERTARTVRAGREKLQGRPAGSPADGSTAEGREVVEPDDAASEEVFFDQDRR